MIGLILRYSEKNYVKVRENIYICNYIYTFIIDPK